MSSSLPGLQCENADSAFLVHSSWPTEKTLSVILSLGSLESCLAEQPAQVLVSVSVESLELDKVPSLLGLSCVPHQASVGP